jgi:hypothetical protein
VLTLLWRTQLSWGCFDMMGSSQIIKTLML